MSDTRKLLSVAMLYGAADMLVMAVGGFLLLPLYTRTLTQADFGTYVAVKANVEIFTYMICLGLPSAVSRVYFDYRKKGQHVAYISSVLIFFGLCLMILLLLLSISGELMWSMLSPGVPSYPYLAFSLGLAVTGFLATIGSLWLRMEGRAKAFALVQVGSAAVLSGMAVINLVALDLGLPGLLWALLASTAISALLLPWLLGRDFSFSMQWEHIRSSWTFAGPSLLGYVAYFLLNRISTLVLQRHVPMDEVAVFGLSQQLAMMVTIAAGAFGKAQQPMVFSAAPADVPRLLDRTGSLLRVMMLGVTGLLLLFSTEILALVAPPSYGKGLPLLLVLLVANFANSFTQVSDTALLYHRRPRTSVAISIFGALLSLCLSLLLVPHYHAMGAASAIAGTFAATAFLSHWLAWRLTGQSYLGPMLVGLSLAAALAAVAAWLAILDWPAWLSILMKLGLLACLAATVGWRHFRP